MNIITRVATLEDLSILLEFEQQLIAVERPMDISLEQKRNISYYDIGAFIFLIGSKYKVFVKLDYKYILITQMLLRPMKKLVLKRI